MPFRDWFRPPRSLFIVLSLLTLVAVSSLTWFGFRALQQREAATEEQRRERLERGADRVAASMRGNLAEVRKRLSAWATTPPPDGQPEEGVLLTGRDEPASAFPKGRLLYWPSQPFIESADDVAFAPAERLEFAQNQEERAAEWYRSLADSNASAAIEAGALLRLGRVLRKLGKKTESREVYARLAQLGHTSVAGVPSDLVARHELCELSGRAADAKRLQNDLLLGRWRLSRGQFQFYWSEAVRLSGRDDSPLPPASVALTDAAAIMWRDTPISASGRGERTLWVDEKPFLAIWQLGPRSRSLLVLPLDSMLERLSHSEEVDWAIADLEGRVLVGRKDGSGRAVVRTPAEGQLPWTLYVTGLPSSGDAGLLARKRFLLAAIAIMVLCVLAGSYFIARAIRKEMAVSQLQASFVSAVSHEFRSPLTSIRQLSEILAEGRAPNDRRQIYYETLLREAGRLQRLVETLLDFGRMEAGARRYKFQTMEAGELARQVTAEFEPQLAGSGRHIELKGPFEHCAVEADRDAVAVALRNLVDNALKYSPDSAGISVEWGRENGYVAIRVHDQGQGIAAFEQKAIFKKFVRGSAAIAGKVKGTGVGLTIAREIAIAHRGEIKVASEPGAGSTFTLVLPAAERS
jgi:signal transduction histidine kinase